MTLRRGVRDSVSSEMNARRIRQQSLREAERLGYPTNKGLPFLDDTPSIRTFQETTDRIFCLTAMVSVAYGYASDKAKGWLERQGLVGRLSAKEVAFLSEQDDPVAMQARVEALWALAWVVNAVPVLDFGQACSERFVTLLPNVPEGQPVASFREKWRLRTAGELLAARDLAYCLHWAIRDAGAHRRTLPRKLHPVYVIERRRALESLMSNDDWDDVQLDT